MRFPNAVWNSESLLKFTDALGNPIVDERGEPLFHITGNTAAAYGSDNAMYFVVAVKGTYLPYISSTANNSYDIAVGKISKDRVLQWFRLLPGLNTDTHETDPVLALGPENEMYIAYVTRGSTANNMNMMGIPTFCPQVCTNISPEDIVIARVNTTDNNPMIQWCAQNGNFNSCNGETNPSISVDKVNKLVYVGFQSNANIQCNTSTGAPNVALVCYNMAGTYYWTDSILLNSNGINQNIAVAADTFSNVYIAYETTVRGERYQIRVVKYTTQQINNIFVRYSLAWMSDQTCDIVARAINYDSEGNPIDTPICTTPTIVCNPSGLVNVMFVTSGVMPGQSTTGSLRDLVALCLDPNGALKWLYQGARFNEAAYNYIDCFDPYVSCDIYGNLYASLITQTNIGYNVILFKLSSTSGDSQWSYTSASNNVYNAYPMAIDDGVRPVLPTGSIKYTKTILSIHNGVFMATLNVGAPNYVRIYEFKENLYFENVGAYGYMKDIKAGCVKCKSLSCGC